MQRATRPSASLDQKAFLRLVFVRVVVSLPSAFTRLVTVLWLPKASVTDFVVDSLPSALWRFLIVLWLPKASVVVVFVWLLKASVLVVVTLVACAQAVPAHPREIARAAPKTARVFTTTLLSVVALPRKSR